LALKGFSPRAGNGSRASSICSNFPLLMEDSNRLGFPQTC
jgi:hypothetical protein